MVEVSRQERRLGAAAGIAALVFIALTVAVGTSSSLGIDARAFTTAHDLQAPWLTHAARIITNFGLIAIVGPAVLLGAGLLARTGHRARAVVLVAGAAGTWVSVWITKWAVDRPRPPAPLAASGRPELPVRPRRQCGRLARAGDRSRRAAADTPSTAHRDRTRRSDHTPHRPDPRLPPRPLRIRCDRRLRARRRRLHHCRDRRTASRHPHRVMRFWRELIDSPGGLWGRGSHASNHSRRRTGWTTKKCSAQSMRS